MKRGLIYIVFGQKALNMAKISFKSFKQHNPQVPVTIFTDLPDMAKDFDYIHEYSNEELLDIDCLFKRTNKFSSLKVRFLKMSPYDQTLYLDADTFVKGDLDEIFTLLDTYEFVVTLDSDKRSDGKKMYNINLTSNDPTLVNCGVFAYKKTNIIEQFLDLWWSAFLEDTTKNEQGVLRSLLRNNEIMNRFNINMKTIDNKVYNCVGSMWPKIHSMGLWENCRILHSQLLYNNRDMPIDELYKVSYP
jgi:lipopolysaccharide biosynthesis glycosyltransferase